MKVEVRFSGGVLGLDVTLSREEARMLLWECDAYDMPARRWTRDAAVSGDGVDHVFATLHIAKM
jgi:hypothetical protein